MVIHRCIWAAFDGTPDKVLALLDAGADGGAKNDKNETPFDRAKKNEKLKGTDAYWAFERRAV